MSLPLFRNTKRMIPKYSQVAVDYSYLPHSKTRAHNLSYPFFRPSFDLEMGMVERINELATDGKLKHNYLSSYNYVSSITDEMILESIGTVIKDPQASHIVVFKSGSLVIVSKYQITQYLQKRKPYDFLKFHELPLNRFESMHKMEEHYARNVKWWNEYKPQTDDITVAVANIALHLITCTYPVPGDDSSDITINSLWKNNDSPDRVFSVAQFWNRTMPYSSLTNAEL